MRSKKVIAQPPDGLFYIPDFIDTAQERNILETIDALPFGRSMLGVFEAKRTVVHYGGENVTNSYGDTHSLNDLPEWLQPIRARCAALLSIDAQDIRQVLVTRYEEAGIGWHRDSPQYGPTVVGLSLGGENRMRFRRMQAEVEEHFQLQLQPRSLYIMSGESRASWQHSMPVTKQLRYSITLRTLKLQSTAASLHATTPGAQSSIPSRLSELNLRALSASSLLLPGKGISEEATQLKLQL